MGVGIVFVGNAHPALALAHAAGQQIALQRQVDHFFIGWPLAFDQRQIGFAGFTVAELVLQAREGAAFFGHQQHTRGVAVQAVHQLQHARTGSGLAQLLNHAKAHAAAAMHRHTGRFVDGQHLFVFKQNGEFTARGHRRIGRGGGHPHRRHAHQITGLHPGVGTGAAFVDPHLTGSDDAVHMGFGHTLQVAQQKIVQALTGGFLVHRQVFDRGGGGGVCVYNDLHQCQVLSA